MIRRPAGTNSFEFAVVCGLRAAQLTRGCTPRVASEGKLITIAQMEVAAGLVAREPLPAKIVPPV